MKNIEDDIDYEEKKLQKDIEIMDSL